MDNLIIDACSLINLINVRALEFPCSLQRCRIWVAPLVVEDELQSCRKEVEGLIAGGELRYVDESAIPLDHFQRLVLEGSLGLGEAVSIAGCIQFGYRLCSDDRRARLWGRKFLGEDRVIGSARLLQWSVEEAIIRCGDAAQLFLGMRERGGFVPLLGEKFFCNGIEDC